MGQLQYTGLDYKLFYISKSVKSGDYFYGVLMQTTKDFRRVFEHRSLQTTQQVSWPL